MEVITHQVVPVVEASQPGAARFTAREVAETAGFSEADVHRAGIVATELATNIVKHATGGGELLMRVVSTVAPAEIELLAIDRGPGIHDLSQSWVDGHSTAGSAGTGLGAIRRLSEDCDIYTEVDRGTVVVARLRAGRAARQQTPAFTVGVVSVAKSGEFVCGDAWCVQHRPDSLVVLVADGLGHGHSAAEASAAALTTFSSRAFASSVDALQAIHDGLRHTRGAAAAIAEVDRRQRIVKFAGVGNISGLVCANGHARQAVSHNGTLGHQARYFREYSYPWEQDTLMVVHSDGLGSHWSLDSYPGIRARHPAIISAVLYRDHSRQRDDVTVLVVREAV